VKGRTGAGGGPRLPAHQVTTRNLGAAYPLLSEVGLGHRGVLVGRDLLGGSFVFDPFEQYSLGVVSNPNMVVLGQIGRGKSAFVKSYLWRQSVFGRRAWVVDPKGEYGTLARLWGVEPVALRPGGPVRLNPLDPVPDAMLTRSGDRDWLARSGPRDPRGALDAGAGDGAGVDRRQSELLASLAGACLGRDLGPRERVAVDLALVTLARRRGVPTLPAVVESLLAPEDEAARSIRTDRRALLEDGRDVALELRRLVHGDLRGMFDGPTTPRIDLGARAVVLDLSAVYDSAALGILMTCAAAWLQAALVGERRAPRIVVVDEAWAILSHLGIARWLRSSWKLARALGVASPTPRRGSSTPSRRASWRARPTRWG
jgi:hypothetical protein